MYYIGTLSHFISHKTNQYCRKMYSTNMDVRKNKNSNMSFPISCRKIKIPWPEILQQKDK